MLHIGLDEVGRGCWAGPLLAAAVALPAGYKVAADANWRLADSKQLSSRQRQLAAAGVRSVTQAIGLGWVTAQEIDSVGLGPAVALAMRRAYQALPVTARQAADSIIIDGSVNYLPDVPGSQAIVKADGAITPVSAASIVAKVARDQYMQIEAAKQYPGYGFERHVGYGTSQHRQALQQLGLCQLHRRSFRPIRELAAD